MYSVVRSSMESVPVLWRLLDTVAVLVPFRIYGFQMAYHGENRPGSCADVNKLLILQCACSFREMFSHGSNIPGDGTRKLVSTLLLTLTVSCHHNDWPRGQ